MRRILRRPASWFAALLLWLAALWLLSSHSGSSKALPVEHLDKLAHFSYFFAGGVLLASWRITLQPDKPRWNHILLTTVATMAVIGFLDEWHQCFTPGRNGADPWDWLADALGATAGAFATKFIYHRLPGVPR
jgi:VanZ family protein